MIISDLEYLEVIFERESLKPKQVTGGRYLALDLTNNQISLSVDSHSIVDKLLSEIPTQGLFVDLDNPLNSGDANFQFVHHTRNGLSVRVLRKVGD